MSDDPELTNDACFGQVLNSITDRMSKKIVSTYRHSSTYAQNLAKINSSSFTYLELEKCAVILKIKQHDPLNPQAKLFDNKKTVADRIILRIESHLPEECDECSTTYSNKFGDDPPLLSCFICLQGSHNCDALKNKMDGYSAFAENKPIGFNWMCKGCRLKNDLYASKPKKAVKFQSKTNVSVAPEATTEEPPNVDHDTNNEEDEEEDEDENEDRPSPRRNADDQTEEREICPLYKKNQCPHGASGKFRVNGEACQHPHPRKCLNFCRYGNKSGRGCQKGRSCPKYHPILCKFSVRNGECRKQDCTFTHLRHTKRPKDGNDREVPSYHDRRATRQEYKPPSNYDRDFPPLNRARPRYDSNLSLASSVSRVSDQYRTPRFRQKPPPVVQAAPRSHAKGNSEMDFLVKLIENMKASFDKEIHEIKVRLSPPEQQSTYPDPFPQPHIALTQVPQMTQHHLPQIYPYNPQYNPSSLY